MQYPLSLRVQIHLEFVSCMSDICCTRLCSSWTARRSTFCEDYRIHKADSMPPFSSQDLRISNLFSRSISKLRGSLSLSSPFKPHIMDSSTLSEDSSNSVMLPALFPPPGVTSNFNNPASRGSALVITSAVCIPFMVICVLVRFYTKLYIRKTWGWDDWTCIPATIGSIGFAAVSLSTLGEGVGPHQWNVPITAFTPSLLRRFVVLDILYSPAILMAKLSLLLLYLQIFHVNVRLRYCIHFSMAFISLFYCGTFIAYAILSIPKPGQSQLAAILSVDTARDIPLGITQGSVGVATDFFIFCLPIPVVWKLQLPLRKKIGVLAIFMTGLLACIAGAFGLYYRVKLGRNSDVTWKLVFVLLWVVVELTVGVICSCLTSFPGFFRYHLPLLRSILSFFSSSFRSFHLSRPLNRSSNPSDAPGSKPSSTKRLATRNFKLTLGSRVDGGGRFMGPASVFATNPDWLPLSEVTRNSPTTTDSNRPDATHREYYEMAEQQLSQIQHPPPPADHQSQGDHRQSVSHTATDVGLSANGEAPTTKQSRNSGNAWWKRHQQTNTTRTGYWDIMSFFRSGIAASPGQSKMHSGSDSSAV